MLVRAYEHENGAAEGYSAELPYLDAAEIPDWALAAVAKALSLGLADGDADGAYRPFGSVTRGEAAKIIVEFRTL